MYCINNNTVLEDYGKMCPRVVTVLPPVMHSLKFQLEL